MKFNPEKLKVEYRNGVTPTGPIIDRKYTLTHSDVTAELFLTVGLEYAVDKINIKRDEVLGEWSITWYGYLFKAYCHVDGEMGKDKTKHRFRIFKNELGLALKSICHGDGFLFKAYPFLDDSRIYIHFNSRYAEYNRVEHWGVFSTWSSNI